MELKKGGKCCQLLCFREGYIEKEGDYPFCPVHAREILSVEKGMVKLDDHKRKVIEEIAKLKE